MYLVKAARWHLVDLWPSAGGTPARRCSVCAGADLRTSDQIVLDAVTTRRYRVVRCHGCGYDLLEPLATATAVIA